MVKIKGNSFVKFSAGGPRSIYKGIPSKISRKKITKDLPVKKKYMEILYKMNPDQNWKTGRKTERNNGKEREGKEKEKDMKRKERKKEKKEKEKKKIP